MAVFNQEEIKRKVILKLKENNDLEIQLSRYMSLDRFLKNIKCDSLLFSNPTEWKNKGYDNYEDLLTRAKLPYLYDINGINFFENFFAISWNGEEKENERMWKEYASLESGIRIKVSLKNILFCIIDNFFNVGYFSTKIYQNENEVIRTIIEKILFFKIVYKDDILETIRNYLLKINNKKVLDYSHIISLKRNMYSFEDEFRIALDDIRVEKFKSQFSLENNSLTIYGINKHINEIVFSPKFDNEEFEKFKKGLELNPMINAKVSKSKIYDLSY